MKQEARSTILSAHDQPLLFLTYTCPVSRFTYAGHPSRGTLYEHTNDLHDAVDRIKRIASSHHQPVTWVVNDQEYLNLEGMLPKLLRWQSEGDSVLVTMELTTSPQGVDKKDTAEVLRWIAARCSEAGLRPDGLWSLKFFESDLKAIATLPIEEFGWTRNLAGSCWHQLGIDDSTWLGCPFNPYYPAAWNSKAAAQPDDSQDFLMLEWLTRDIQACLNHGFPATFSLDPADSNRRDAGGFATEAEALRYSVSLIDETARQIAFNRTVVVNINEEARHYQTEGHDKDVMLDGMFRRFAEIAADPPTGTAVRQSAYSEVWRSYRLRHAHTPESIYVCGDLDWRSGEAPGADPAYANRVRGDAAVLFQDTGCQMAFLRSRGPLPVELYDYTARVPGADSNDPYPDSALPKLQLRERTMAAGEAGLDVSLTLHASGPAEQFGVMIWDAPVKGDEVLREKGGCVVTARATPVGLFIRMRLTAGENRAEVRLARQPRPGIGQEGS